MTMDIFQWPFCPNLLKIHFPMLFLPWMASSYSPKVGRDGGTYHQAPNHWKQRKQRLAALDLTTKSEGTLSHIDLAALVWGGGAMRER